MKRVLKIDDGINVCKYEAVKEYEGYVIYQRVTPNGYFVHNEWALYDLGCEDDQFPIVIESYNDISLNEVLDAIDQRNYDGDFGWKVFYRLDHSPRIVVHPNGDTRI